MTNGIELNDQELSEVIGGKTTNTIDINKLASLTNIQGNAAFAPTFGFATSGKDGTTSFEQLGSEIGLGNTNVQIASNG
jgi:bacteriocin-like protein